MRTTIPKEHEDMREIIKRQTREFLIKGKQIKEVKPGVSGGIVPFHAGGSTSRKDNGR